MLSDPIILANPRKRGPWKRTTEKSIDYSRGSDLTIQNDLTTKRLIYHFVARGHTGRKVMDLQVIEHTWICYRIAARFQSK